VLPYAQVTANSALIAAAISALPALLALAEAVSKAPEVPVEFEPHARLRVIAGGTNSYTGQRVRLVALPDCGEVG
jgi:hypothetical protein